MQSTARLDGRGILAGGLACLILAVPAQAVAQPDGAGDQSRAARSGDGKTVALTADLTIRTTTAGPDGKRDSTETRQRLYRDSRGRTRTETGTAVTISDPVARTTIHVDLASRTYRQAAAPDSTAKNAKRDRLSSESRPLGTRIMQDVLVEGRTQIVTMPASHGRAAERREVTIWHSAALKLPVQTRIVAESGAESVQTYSNIRTGEPAASRFDVPQGYREGAATAAAATDLHTVALLDGQVHHRIRFANGAWTDWGLLGNPGMASSVGAATTAAGDLHVAVASEGHLYHRIRFVNGAWSNNWELVETGATASSVALATTPGGGLYLVAVADHYPIYRFRSAGGVWSPATFPSFDLQVFGEIAASTTSAGDLHLAALYQAQVFHGILAGAGTWTGWGFLGNPGLASAIGISTTPGGDLHTAAVLNGQIHHRIRFTNGGWTDWGFLGNPGTASAIGVSTTPDGDLHTAAVLNGQIHHRIRLNNGGWTDWGFLGNPGTATDVAVATSTPPPDLTPCPIYAPDSVPLVSFGPFLGAAVVEATTDGAKGCRFIDSSGYAEAPLDGLALTGSGMDYFQWYVYDDGGPVPFLPWFAYGVIEWVAARDGVAPSRFQTLLVLYIDS